MGEKNKVVRILYIASVVLGILSALISIVVNVERIKQMKRRGEQLPHWIEFLLMNF